MKKKLSSPIIQFEDLMKEKFNPRIFSNFEDFKKFSGLKTLIDINNYTDGEIDGEEKYKIFTFSDPADFKNVPLLIDEYLTEIIVSYNSDGCFKDMFISGIENDATKYASMLYKELK